MYFVLMAEVNVGPIQSGPGLVWTDGVKVTLGTRGMTVEAARQCVQARKEWRSLVHMQMIEYYTAIFDWFLCSFRLPSRALVAYHLERSEMPLRCGWGKLCKGRDYCYEGVGA